MSFLGHVLLLFLFAPNIPELECRVSQSYTRHHVAPGLGGIDETIEQASHMMTEYSLGFSEVFDDASGIFGRVLGNIINKKKILGIESFYLKK